MREAGLGSYGFDFKANSYSNLPASTVRLSGVLARV
jgi:hypothetical protein